MVKKTVLAPGDGRGLELPRQRWTRATVPVGVILLGPDRTRPAIARRETWDSLLREDAKRLAKQYRKPRRIMDGGTAVSLLK